MTTRFLTAVAVALAFAGAARATQTEHLSFRALPAKSIDVDGKTGDWDLSGGIFACEDVEQQRDNFGVWLHAAYDDEFFYLLARFVDATPMNNPGQTIADYGFAGDSLQFRTRTGDGPTERVEHFTAWRGRDRADVIKLEHGRTFTEGVIADAKKTDGAKQAFSANRDGRGYVQEIAIPWKLLTRDGKPVPAGEGFTLTFEPNFTVGVTGRLTIKDLFREGAKIDRMFTFTAVDVWGRVSLEKSAPVEPQPLRLADGRTLPVSLQDGMPVVDWSGLEKKADDAGIVPIAFTLERDSVVSLNIKDRDGTVVRQLLNTAALKKGDHVVQWDGRRTPSWTRPGEFVAPGDYTWSALTHAGIGLKLRGWAANGGVAPWDSADGRGNWGGDHGVPSAVATDDKQVYLGWSGAEAGKSVLAVDLQGRPLWGNNRAGIAGVKALAAEGGVVFVLGGAAGPDAEGGNLYKLDARTGGYVSWDGSGDADLKIAALWPADATVKPALAQGISVTGGRVHLTFTQENLVLTLDARSGRLLEQRTVPASPASTESAPVTATTTAGKTVFRAYGEPRNQIGVFSDATATEPTSLIGVAGGRRLLGAWQPEGLRFITAMAVDAEGKLWVVESDATPKRISVWDPRSGRLVNEFFGPTSYGALGGAISPLDPDVMVGQGCEWRLDPKTGRARLVAVITRDGMENSRFGIGANGRLYLAVAPGWIHGSSKISFFERTGEGAYALRTVFRYEGTKDAPETALWADENDDGVEQPGEVKRTPGHAGFSGWYMALAPDLTIYSGSSQFKVSGYTLCGAPRYNLSAPAPLPVWGGLGSADARFVVRGGGYGEEHTEFALVDLATGKQRWTYPDNFNGVHGSHKAPPAAVGLIRGSFGITGTAKLPAPIGNIWATATNVGEWHLLTEDGFYLGKLFEPDAMKVKWPERAVPGADMTHVPPGMGGEDFGGTITAGKDGKLYVQAGKTAFWNLEVTGLDTVRALPGGTVSLSIDQVAAAVRAGDAQLQAKAEPRATGVKRASPRLTGNFDNDFGPENLVRFQKGEDQQVFARAAYDDRALYLQWNVRDRTPWVNGAPAPEQLYVGGDTVDFQLATDPGADPARDKAAAGDLRLSIGNFKGKPTVVLFQSVVAGDAPADRPRTPKSFSSGIVKDYTVADVRVLKEATVKVTKRGDGYIVQAAIPWKALDMTAPAGRTLRGDFGATYGDPAGQRTRLRSHWSNQATGLVDDVVFELMLEPRNWGELKFD